MDAETVVESGFIYSARAPGSTIMKAADTFVLILGVARAL